MEFSIQFSIVFERTGVIAITPMESCKAVGTMRETEEDELVDR